MCYLQTDEDPGLQVSCAPSPPLKYFLSSLLLMYVLFLGIAMKCASERFPIYDTVTKVRKALIQKVLRAKRGKNYLLG